MTATRVATENVSAPFEQHLQVVNVYDVDLARDSEDRL
jgi:hypothetical protein